MSDFSRGRFASVALCAFWLVSCNAAGTETDNPLTDFRGSRCKSGANASDSALRLVSKSTVEAAIMAGPEYDGLFCVAWDANDDGDLRVDLYNHRGGCSAEWAGHASQSDAGLALELEVVGCRIAGCGSCIYDLSFELQGIDTSAPLPLALSERSCSDEPDEEIAALTLPLDARPSGVLCRPTPSVYHGTMPQCGRAHLQACGEEGNGYPVQCSESDASACGEGLACAEVAGTGVCLSACSTDADCPLEIEACTDGVCRLRETL